MSLSITFFFFYLQSTKLQSSLPTALAPHLAQATFHLHSQTVIEDALPHTQRSQCSPSTAVIQPSLHCELFASSVTTEDPLSGMC